MDDNAFESTRWSVIDEANHPDERIRRAALERLTQAYYGPMLAYLNRRMPADCARIACTTFCGSSSSMASLIVNGIASRGFAHF